MNSKAVVAALVAALSGVAQAEPVFMPQAASVMKAKQAEVGIGGQFGYQLSEIEGAPGTSYKNRVWHIPLFGRYGITDDVESQLVIPITRAIDSSEGLTSSRYANTGLGNVQIGAKWNVVKERLPLAVALDLDLPTANARMNGAPLGQRYSNQVQQGFNGHLQVIADAPKHDLFGAHASAGYMNTATYGMATGGRFNPSDLFTFGAGVEAKLQKLNVGVEMVGNTAINHSKTNGIKNGNDKGTVLEVGPAARYDLGAVRTFAGVLFDAGNTTFRAYNYRVNFGASLLFGGR